MNSNFENDLPLQRVKSVAGLIPRVHGMSFGVPISQTYDQSQDKVEIPFNLYDYPVCNSLGG